MVDRRRLQRLMLCLIIATSLMGLLALSCAACYDGATRTVPALYMREAPQVAPQSAEMMCFDRLEKSLAKHEKLTFLMSSCAEVVEMLLTELEACPTSPGGLYVRPAPLSDPHRADATYRY
jgi:hypothetical protein